VTTEPEASTLHFVVGVPTAMVSYAGAAAAAAAAAGAAADVVAEVALVQGLDAASEKSLYRQLSGCVSANSSSSPPLLCVCLPNLRQMLQHRCQVKWRRHQQDTTVVPPPKAVPEYEEPLEVLRFERFSFIPMLPVSACWSLLLVSEALPSCSNCLSRSSVRP